MGQKVMLEVTQPVVNGNEVAVHSGELFEPGARLPEGVTVRPVIVSVPDKPAASSSGSSDEGAKQEAAPVKPAAKAAAK